MNIHHYMRKQNKATVIAFGVLVLVFLSYGYKCGLEKVCGPSFVEKVIRSGKELNLPRGTIYAEVVDTPASRELGLSGRKGLATDEGMLFVFDYPGKYGFWMKDMLFSVDMVWISEDGTVVHIERNATPESYFDHKPPQTFVNIPEAKYVLEIAAGQADKLGIYLGSKVKIGE